MAFPRLTPGTPALVLAPMEGVADAPMRALMSERGGFAFCVSEFLRISHEVPPDRVFHRHVPELRRGSVTPCGIPVAVQLLGGDPETLARAASVACRLGAPAIDLNFGCPAPTVNRHDGGATLLKFPDRLGAIVRAVRDAVPAGIPVSAKLRLGWDRLDAIHRNADRAAEGGADWITIHGRTRIAGYAPPAHWEPIGEVRRRLAIPVVANGDIWTIEDFERCRDVTGCEHFMLGRGAIADPSLASRIAARLGAHQPACPAGPFGEAPGDWLALLSRFAELTGPRPDYSGHLTRRIKQWVRMAGRVRPFPWFDELKRTEGVDEIFLALRGRVSRQLY